MWFVKVWAVSAVRYYIDFMVSTVRANHQAYERLFTRRDASRKLACHSIPLYNFDPELMHCADIKQKAADDISKLSTIGINKSWLQSDAPDLTLQNK